MNLGSIEPHTSKIAVLGYGIEGRATLDYLGDLGAPRVSLLDSNPNLIVDPSHQKFTSGNILGIDWLMALDDFDVIIKSPGIPLHVIPSHAHPRLTSATNIFLGLARDKTIGITGTKGKSTTSSLISHILNCAGIANSLGGNIGTPALSLLKSHASTYILELSSYQLELCSISPHGSVLLNLFAEHLDHHGTLQDYFSAKHKIHLFQSPGDFLVIPDSLTRALSQTPLSGTSVRSFGCPDSTAWIEKNSVHYKQKSGGVSRLCRTDELLIPGPGNAHNVLAALSALVHFEIDPTVLREALRSFKPLRHRLQPVISQDRITFVNDSISTIPESTINAITTYSGTVHTLILGGYDRGVPFENLVNYVLESEIKLIILLPPSGSRLESMFKESSKFNPTLIELFSVPSMEEAVTLAKQKTPQNSVCLLSPAAPSYPMFRNFEERGDRFLELALKQSANPDS
jgi:UDP-N-acetylmuramoyl-L-alanine---L-glutamate ligase